MRKYLIIAFCFLSYINLTAQIKVPQISPASKIEQTVGLTNIVINYSRPSAKGRPVFGELVPYGKTWRTGANENTTISLSDDVTISGKILPKGKYAIYTIPKADSWEIIFYKDYENWGLPQQWDDTEVALKVNVNSESLCRHVETFTIFLNYISTDNATLEFSWEKTLVALKIEVPTQKEVMKNITSTLNGPVSNDYFVSSQYLYQTNNDLIKSLEWINKAIDLNKEPEVPFWYYRLKSLILFKLGDKKSAIENAKISLEGAKKANNQDYIKQNTDSINLWSK